MSEISEIRTLGWVGTGVMGRSMVRRLLGAGFPVQVTTRSRSRATELLGEGATWVDSPADLVSSSDAIVSMVGFPNDVEDVYFGPQGILTASRGNRLQLVVDMTTSSPSLAERIADGAAELGVEALDAPVSGGDVGARDGTLSIMVGGSASAFRKAEPIFQKIFDSIRIKK